MFFLLLVAVHDNEGGYFQEFVIAPVRNTLEGKNWPVWNLPRGATEHVICHQSGCSSAQILIYCSRPSNIWIIDVCRVHRKLFLGLGSTQFKWRKAYKNYMSLHGDWLMTTPLSASLSPLQVSPEGNIIHHCPLASSSSKSRGWTVISGISPGRFHVPLHSPRSHRSGHCSLPGQGQLLFPSASPPSRCVRLNRVLFLSADGCPGCHQRVRRRGRAGVGPADGGLRAPAEPAGCQRGDVCDGHAHSHRQRQQRRSTERVGKVQGSTPALDPNGLSDLVPHHLRFDFSKFPSWTLRESSKAGLQWTWSLAFFESIFPLFTGSWLPELPWDVDEQSDVNGRTGESSVNGWMLCWELV